MTANGGSLRPSVKETFWLASAGVVLLAYVGRTLRYGARVVVTGNMICCWAAGPSPQLVLGKVCGGEVADTRSSTPLSCRLHERPVAAAMSSGFCQVIHLLSNFPRGFR